MISILYLIRYKINICNQNLRFLKFPSSRMLDVHVSAPRQYILNKKINSAFTRLQWYVQYLINLQGNVPTN